MILKTLEGLIFLTYHTNYNIKEIYRLLSLYNNTEEIMSENLFKDNSNELYDKTYDAIEQLKFHNIEAIPFYSEKYPKELNDLIDKPPVLYVRGCFKEIRLAAVVGTRKMTNYGRQVIKKIIPKLIDNNYGIVSGLALGIDTEAHWHTIQSSGYTVAVMPCSLNQITPKENYKLANKILDSGGLLVSELLFNISQGKYNFIHRNRIQTGLSKIVIPVEMDIKSGTMHTIRYCKEQKRKLILLNPPLAFRKDACVEGILDLIDKQNKTYNENVFIANNGDEIISFIK